MGRGVSFFSPLSPASPMALPVGPPPKSDDIAVHGWHGITVRVAWALVAHGIRVKPALLRDAREHVLLHLDRATPLPIAEDLASLLTAQYVQRARGRWVPDPWAQDATMPLSPRWRRAIERSLDGVSEVVFRNHYGDSRSLDLIESKLGIDRLVLEGARSGLREIVRKQAHLDGVPIHDWPAERIDRLIGRLSAWSPGPCPPVIDVQEGGHREHLLGCARCDRTARLLRNGVLSAEDMLPPAVGARSDRTATVLAIQFHADARQHRAAFRKELDATAVAYGEDLLLIDGKHAPAAWQTLLLAAELGAPRATHLRAAFVEGPGYWSRHGLLGPLADRADQEVRGRSWGAADGVGELPEPLPEPPSARRAWAALTALLAVCWMAISWTGASARAASQAPLDVTFTEGRGGIWTDFDVDDRAVVTVVRRAPDGTLAVVVPGQSSADKALVATGDGRFRLHAEGTGVLVAATPAPVPDLEERIAQSASAADPLAALEAAIHQGDPAADIRVRTR